MIDPAPIVALAAMIDAVRDTATDNSLPKHVRLQAQTLLSSILAEAAASVTEARR